MSNANIFGIVMIYLAISTFLYLGGVRVVAEDTSNFLGNFVDVNAYENGTIKASGEFENTVPESYSESGAGDILSFIDVLGAIKDFLIFLANIILSPIGLFIGAGIPQAIALMIALPLLVAGVFGFISFIRSGQ